MLAKSTQAAAQRESSRRHRRGDWKALDGRNGDGDGDGGVLARYLAGSYYTVTKERVSMAQVQRDLFKCPASGR